MTMTTPGDDGGAPIGVQSTHLAAPRLGQGGETLEDGPALVEGHHVPWTLSGDKHTPIQVHRAERVAVPATAMAVRARLADLGWNRFRVDARGRRARARAAPAASGGSVARWRSCGGRRPAWVETWKLTSSPLPTTSSVEPPPTSIDERGRRVTGAGARWSRRGR
jgi:hypothetical protein